jgi:hypothetical protein
MTKAHEKDPLAIPLDALADLAASVAPELRGEITPAVRARFIQVRSALFQRGIYDPVLVRFDSATAPRATAAEVADQLEQVAASLRPVVA